MKNQQVKDIMVPITEYATVSADANLQDAVLALEKAQQEFNRNNYTHRAILVYDKNNKIVGKVSQMDIIRALEPKYLEMQDHAGMSRYGFSKKFINSLIHKYKLWNNSISDICYKASELLVSEIMYTPSDKEIVDINASFEEAIHMLVMGHHQSLLVTDGEDIVGILRLTDVFSVIIQVIKK